MQSKKLKCGLILIVLMVIGFSAGQISAAGLGSITGSLDSPGPPGSTKSFTLEDIYQRLDNGADGSQTTFKEPPTGPTAGSMYTLNQIMAKAPLTDNTDGAQKGHVLAGKKFWGLTGAQWGQMTGTRAPAPVPRSGQTVKVSNYDDGDLQKGILWPNPRFIDNIDGTVTDKLTGLIWLQDASCWSSDNWSDSVGRPYGLKSGDCNLSDGSESSDWRMPNVSELRSLIDFSASDPALPSGHPFVGVSNSWYWTSTKYKPTAEYFWVISLGDGKSEGHSKWGGYLLWPVRDP